MLALAATAQETLITLQNLAPHPRSEWFAAVVPFAQGAAGEVPDLHVEQHPTVWQPFGARWPDGSIRQALCFVAAALEASSEVRLPLKPGPGPALTWQAPVLEFTVTVEVRAGERAETAVPAFAEVLEANAARRVELHRCRIGGTGLLLELILTRYQGQEHLRADVALWFSDPTTKAMACPVDEVTLVTKGAALLLRHPSLFGVRTALTADGSRVTLLAGQGLGDGQGIRRAGVLVPPLRGDDSTRDRTVLAVATCPPLGATVWSASGAFGPFGLVPPPPPWLEGDALRAAFRQRHVAFVQQHGKDGGDPFVCLPFGLAKEAGQTGDQADFGVVKLEPVAATGLPSFLLEVEPSVLQEACRPVHVFEADGRPVRARDHPAWVVWSGRTHWHCDVSKDRLGKPCPEPRFDAHQWTGKDREHWSSLYLGAFALLTGEPWARRQLQNEAELWKASETTDPRLSTSGTGPPRAAGRTLLAGCWVYLATGDEELLARMHARVDEVHAKHWAGAALPEGRVRPFSVHAPDPRMLAGKHRYWTPWQDSLAVLGFAAFGRLTGNPRALQIADAVALNALRHGWRTEPGKEPIIATAVRWQDGGEPLTGEQLASGDQTLVLWSDGTAFSEWAIGAVEWARLAAVQAGDDAMRVKAEGLLAFLRGRRPVPRDGWFDRLGAWDAVR